MKNKNLIPVNTLKNIKDENLIPREFLKVDEVKIRKVITALKEEAQIPGIKIIKKKIIGA